MALVVIEKILTNTDIDLRLNLASESLQYFQFEVGVQYVDFTVIDLTEENIRVLRLCKRKNGHPKPVISKGWREYVIQKGLRTGDKVIMRVNDNIDHGGASFIIQAQRNDMIMVDGEPLWYDVL